MLSGLLLLFSHDNADVCVFLLKMNESMLTFEGQQFQGVQAIMKKITVSFILAISCLVLFQIAFKEGVFLVCFSFVVHEVKDKRL